MVLSIYTAYNTRSLRLPAENNKYTTPSEKEVQRVLGPKKGRRVIELAFVAGGIALVALGFVAFFSGPSWGTYASYGLFGVGGYLMLDGLIAVIIDFAKRKRTPKDKRVINKGSYEEYTIPGRDPLNPKLGKGAQYTRTITNPDMTTATLFYHRDESGRYHLQVKQGAAHRINTEAGQYHTSEFPTHKDDTGHCTQTAD